MIKHPTYTAELVTSRCSVELSLNGIPTFNTFEEGTVSVDWNLNLLIQENGLQNLTCTIMPLKGETIIRNNAIVRIKLVMREAIDEYVNQEIITEEIELNFSENINLPVFVHQINFKATLPYIVEGWKNSVDLSTEDEGKLLSEVLRWNQKIIDIHHNTDKQKYLNIFSKKNAQVCKALYLSDEEIEFENNSIFNANDKNLFALPSDLYKLELYSDNKLVSVRIPYELPGFTYEPKIKNEDSWGFGLNIYFHRQKVGEQLEIIR